MNNQEKEVIARVRFDGCQWFESLRKKKEIHSIMLLVNAFDIISLNAIFIGNNIIISDVMLALTAFKTEPFTHCVDAFFASHCETHLL